MSRRTGLYIEDLLFRFLQLSNLTSISVVTAGEHSPCPQKPNTWSSEYLPFSQTCAAGLASTRHYHAATCSAHLGSNC